MVAKSYSPKSDAAYQRHHVYARNADEAQRRLLPLGAALRRTAMLNDASSALALLQTRRSGKPRELVGPAPTDAELQQMLEIAVRVPDHGQLSPWRLVIVAEDQR